MTCLDNVFLAFYVYSVLKQLDYASPSIRGWYSTYKHRCFTVDMRVRAQEDTDKHHSLTFPLGTDVQFLDIPRNANPTMSHMPRQRQRQKPNRKGLWID